MGTPLKVSDSLFTLAKQEAQATQRSITAQVEHWARIGRAVEGILAHEELLTLKQVGELLTPVFSTAARQQEVHELLSRIADSSDREATKTALRASGTPLYTTDPEHPGLIIQAWPDGRRIPGSLEGRRFVPAEQDSIKGTP
jgi:ParD-like antitoxin of type II bacterial toxin-antitoxin system